jgi:flagellar motor switch protein FliN/FliY
MADEALAEDAAALRQIANEMREDASGAKAAAGTKAAAGGRTEPVGLAQNLETIMRIPITVKIVLGSATMPVADLAKLGRGAVIPLDRRVGEPVDVVVNGRIVARGEVVVTDDDTSRFGIALTEVVGPNSGDLSG